MKDIDHGTTQGYQAHRRYGSEPCSSCKRAWADYYRNRRDSK